MSNYEFYDLSILELWGTKPLKTFILPTSAGQIYFYFLLKSP